MSRARTVRRQMERTQRRHAVEPAVAQSTAAQSMASQPTAAQSTTSQSTASAAQTAANRANARHSTGPRTPEGRAQSRRNALKHGLYARTLSLAANRLGEDRAEFETLWADLCADYAPESTDERLLVERIATAWWQLSRLGTQCQLRLRELLDAGADPLQALKQSEGIGPAEARLERSLMRMHRNLAFLQKWRSQTAREHEKASRHQQDAAHQEWIAAYNAETEAVIQDGLRRAHERREAERLQPEAVAEGESAAEAQGVDAEVTVPGSAPDFGGAFEPLDGAFEPQDEPEAAPQGAESIDKRPARSAA